MITKITHIVCLSRFKHFSSSDAKIEFDKTTMFYAPNGRGKTSVADILRSVITDSPSLLDKRKSKVYPGDTEVTVTHSSPAITSRFSSGSWTNTPTDITCLTFDKDFIQQNIHTITVDHDHKKKLHGLIVGASALEARMLVKDQRDILVKAQQECQSIQKSFPGLSTKNINYDEFIKLKEGEIKALEGEKQLLVNQIEALGNPEAINAMPVLVKIDYVDIDNDMLVAACTATVEGGSKEAVDLIEQHSHSHVNGSTEEAKAFLSVGTKAFKSGDVNSCALCGQPIGDSAKPLVEALFAIFSAEYQTLRSKITSCNASLSSSDFDTLFTKLENIIEVNQSRHTAWKKYIEKLPDTYQVDNLVSLQKNFNDSKTALISVLSTKSDNLSLVVTDELKSFQDANTAICNQLDAYSKRVEQINLVVTEYKKSLDIGAKQAIVNRINTINNLVIRSSLSGKAFCADYNSFSSKVTAADIAYKKALKDFATAQENVINKHGELINEILEYCGAKFRLNGMSQGTRLGSTEPYIEYSISLNGGTQESEATAVEAIGDILSEGEKNLLAFAFFWSLIKHSDLEKTVSIFDDPLSSVDQSWRLQLIDKLKELCDSGLMQLFVLTHYEDFGRTVALRINGIKQITIEAGGATNGNTLAAYDIEAVSKELQFSRIEKLRNYIDDPSTASPKDIQSEIRTILEAALKYKYYLKLRLLIDGKKWLRDFIEEPSTKPLLVANQTYSTLDTLCVNGGWANHDNPPSQIFDQDQALAYAHQTLDVLEKL